MVELVAHAPALSAARLRIDAARARMGSAGKFPNPEIEAMVSRKQSPMETMPMYEVSVRQPLPKAGERAADRDRVAAGVSMAQAEYALMAGEMAAETAMALAEAETATRRADVLAIQMARVQRVLGTVEIRIGTGQGRLGELLALRTQIASMQLMIARDRTMAATALSDARSRLGLADDAILPAYFAPIATDVILDSAPALRMAEARIQEAHAMGRMARAEAKPMTAIGLRLEREQDSMGNTDTIGIAFMMEIPWRSRGYARADEQAARTEAHASRADARANTFQIMAALKSIERAEKLAALTAQLADDTQTRVDAEYESIVSSASAGTMSDESTVLMVLDILEKSTNAQLQRIDAEGAVRVARAELWRYLPVETFINSSTDYHEEPND
ncbi:MAG: TolC family protein [Verrucomicrobiota bacterium]|nr:TolC family protein [Verrucomicrobiota bacterium]